MKKVLAGWNKVCPGCNIARKYPKSFIGKRVREHWEKGCAAHNAYVEVYGANEPTPKKSAAKAGAAAKKAPAGAPRKNNPTGPAAKNQQKKVQPKATKK